MNDHPVRVLVVDDHPAVRAGLGLALVTEPGLELCGMAGTAELGVELVLTLHPDVVVMDVTLPGIDGLSAVELMRERGDRVPVVVLSAREDPALLERARTLGVHHYVVKTVGLQRLLDSVREAATGAPAS
jgi:DNA-binding NarL/FixJ family response regulator